MNNLDEVSSRMLQEVCDNIKTAIEQGRTDIIKSVLEACKNFLLNHFYSFGYHFNHAKLIIT
jgi:hypothetical protein